MSVCPRCGGRLMFEAVPFGAPELTCVNCSYSGPTRAPEPEDSISRRSQPRRKGARL